jgi:hypothetical protein
MNDEDYAFLGMSSSVGSTKRTLGFRASAVSVSSGMLASTTATDTTNTRKKKPMQIVNKTTGETLDFKTERGCRRFFRENFWNNSRDVDPDKTVKEEIKKHARNGKLKHVQNGQPLKGWVLSYLQPQNRASASAKSPIRKENDGVVDLTMNPELALDERFGDDKLTSEDAENLQHRVIVKRIQSSTEVVVDTKHFGQPTGDASADENADSESTDGLDPAPLVSCPDCSRTFTRIQTMLRHQRRNSCGTANNGKPVCVQLCDAKTGKKGPSFSSQADAARFLNVNNQWVSKLLSGHNDGLHKG